MASDPCTLRAEAERVIGEDRVPEEELRRLVAAFGPPEPEEVRTFALVVAVAAPGPEAAWEFLHDRLTKQSAAGDIEVPYVGAAWEGIPEGATEIATAAISLELTHPSGSDFVHGAISLTPCE